MAKRTSEQNRAIYERRQERAKQVGETGYSAQRVNRRLDSLRTKDIFLLTLPPEYRTRENAKLFDKGFRHEGKMTKAQMKAREQFLAIVEGKDIFDFNVYGFYYANYIKNA